VVGAEAAAAAMLLPQAFVQVGKPYPGVTFSVRAGSELEIVEMAGGTGSISA